MKVLYQFTFLAMIECFSVQASDNSFEKNDLKENNPSVTLVQPQNLETDSSQASQTLIQKLSPSNDSAKRINTDLMEKLAHIHMEGYMELQKKRRDMLEQMTSSLPTYHPSPVGSNRDTPEYYQLLKKRRDRLVNKMRNAN